MGKSDLSFEQAVAWQCPCCLTVIESKDNQPRCPRCGLMEGPS
jgi:rubrerythrin